MKKEIKIMLILYCVSFVLAVVGFFIDSDIRNPSVFVNIFETFVLSFVIYIFISLIYFLTFSIVNWLRKLIVD